MDYREITWTNGLRPGSWRAFLLLADKASDRLMLFTAESIPGVCRVLSKEGTKNGKWSNTTFLLRLGHTVEAFPGVGFTADGVARAAGCRQGAGWEALGKAFGVSPEAVKKCIQGERAEMAELIDTFDLPGV